MLRRFVLIPLILLLAVLLSGCHYIKGDLTVNEEGLVSGTVTVAVPKNTDPKLRQKIFKEAAIPTPKEYVKVEDFNDGKLIGKTYTYTDAPFESIFPPSLEVTFKKTGDSYVIESKAGLDQTGLKQLKTAKKNKKKPKKINYSPQWAITITMPVAIESVPEGMVVDPSNPNKVTIPNEFFSAKTPFTLTAGEAVTAEYNPEDFTPRVVTAPVPPQAPTPPSNIPVIISWLLIVGGLLLAVFARKIDFVGLQRAKAAKAKEPKKAKKVKSKKK